jgi:hypothetical protein
MSEHLDQGSAPHIVSYDKGDCSTTLCPHGLLEEAAATTAEQDDLATDLGCFLQ